jgi:hypothetical protein
MFYVERMHAIEVVPFSEIDLDGKELFEYPSGSGAGYVCIVILEFDQDGILVPEVFFALKNAVPVCIHPFNLEQPSYYHPCLLQGLKAVIGKQFFPDRNAP